MKLRIILSFVALSFAFVHQAHAKEIEILKFNSPVEIVGTVFVEVVNNNVSFWGIPFPEDKEGIEKIKEWNKKGKYGNFKPSLNAFKYEPASIKLAFSDEMKISKSDFNTELIKEVISHFSEKDAIFKCYASGFDSVPQCETYDNTDTPLSQSFVRKGFAIMDKQRLTGYADHDQKVIEAEDQAKELQVGIWKPFHFLMHNISE